MDNIKGNKYICENDKRSERVNDTFQRQFVIRLQSNRPTSRQSF